MIIIGRSHRYRYQNRSQNTTKPYCSDSVIRLFILIISYIMWKLTYHFKLNVQDDQTMVSYKDINRPEGRPWFPTKTLIDRREDDVLCFKLETACHAASTQGRLQNSCTYHATNCRIKVNKIQPKIKTLTSSVIQLYMVVYIIVCCSESRKKYS